MRETLDGGKAYSQVPLKNSRLYAGLPDRESSRVDSYFQSDLEYRKSTSDYVFSLGGGAISWRSVKQSSIANSTIEVGSIGALEATIEVV